MRVVERHQVDDPGVLKAFGVQILKSTSLSKTAVFKAVSTWMVHPYTEEHTEEEEAHDHDHPQLVGVRLGRINNSFTLMVESFPPFHVIIRYTFLA